MSVLNLLSLWRLLFRLSGALVLLVTATVAVGYAGFMIVWMHAPPLHVAALTIDMSVPPLVLGWAAVKLANWIGRSTAKAKGGGKPPYRDATEDPSGR